MKVNKIRSRGDALKKTNSKTDDTKLSYSGSKPVNKSSSSGSTKSNRSNNANKISYEPSLTPLKSKVNDHKVKSITSINLENQGENSAVAEKIHTGSINKHDEEIKSNDNQLDSLDSNQTIQFKPLANLSQDEIDLVPKPTDLDEDLDRTGSSSNLDQSNLTTCTQNLYRELLRMVENGKSLEKLNKKSKDYTNYLDSIKSSLKIDLTDKSKDKSPIKMNANDQNKIGDQFIALSDDSLSSADRSKTPSRCSSVSNLSVKLNNCSNHSDPLNDDQTENLNENQLAGFNIFNALTFTSLTGLLTSAAYYYYINFY